VLEGKGSQVHSEASLFGATAEARFRYGTCMYPLQEAVTEVVSSSSGFHVLLKACNARTDY